MSPGFRQPEPHGWRQTAEAALAEDLGPGDVSAPATLGAECGWRIEAQGEGVLCGSGIAAWLLRESLAAGPALDGSEVRPGDVVAAGRGPAAAVLAAERTALNFLMALSGTATLARRFVQAVAHTGCTVVDTRKTLPGLRALQKYAVRCGGAANHRHGLYDGVMLKDNHIVAAGSVAEAVRRARSAHHLVRIEVECASLAMVAEAVESGAEAVMLDNMPLDEMRQAVSEFRGRAVFEASGGVTLDTVAEVAGTGVDFVSVGALTHSAPALPFHLECEP